VNPEFAMDPAATPEPGDEDRREAEQLWAKRHHFPTRLLGGAIIASVVLSFVGSLLGDHLDFGGILLLIGGAYVLGGSQAWLRFVTFLYCGAFAAGIGDLLWPILTRQPFTLDSPRWQWVAPTDRDFWLWLVMPTGFVGALASLCLVCLRTRQLRFWTKTARIWGGVFGGIYLVGLGFGAYSTLREAGPNRRTADLFAGELAGLRRYLGTHGVATGSITDPLRQTLAANPAVVGCVIRDAPGGGIRLLGRDDPDPPGDPHTYTEFLRLPSGGWAQLELEVILPP